MRKTFDLLKRSGGVLLASAVLVASCAVIVHARPTAPDSQARPPLPAPPAGHSEQAPPETEADRRKMLEVLYTRLAASTSKEATAALADAIERLWRVSGSDTIDLLMTRAIQAFDTDDKATAREILDAVVSLSPSYAEGWNRRAFVYFQQRNYAAALADLGRVLEIEPRHYQALDGTGKILLELGEKGLALKAFRRLLEVNPMAEGAKEAADQLERQIEGENI